MVQVFDCGVEYFGTSLMIVKNVQKNMALSENSVRLNPSVDHHYPYLSHNWGYTHRIGLREKLQENPIFGGKIHGFL